MTTVMFSDLSQRLDNFEMAYTDNNNNGEKVTVRGDKYSLRPRSFQKEDVEEKVLCKKIRGGKSKQKAAPLSKYRRKTANARERTRMREINAAFEALRRCVPSPTLTPPLPTPSNCEKLTKITTLRLAMKYITALSAALNESNPPPSDLADLLSDCSDLDCLFLESDGESLQLHSDLSDHSLTPPDFSTDFPTNFGTDFGGSLSPTFTDQSLSPFEPFFADFT